MLRKEHAMPRLGLAYCTFSGCTGSNVWSPSYRTVLWSALYGTVRHVELSLAMPGDDVAPGDSTV